MLLTSRKNPTVLEAASLSTDKKARDKTGLFAVEGKKLLAEAFDAGLAVESVFFTEKAEKLYADLLKKAGGAKLYAVTDEVFAAAYAALRGRARPRRLRSVRQLTESGQYGRCLSQCVCIRL